MLTTTNDDITYWPVLGCCVFTAGRNICLAVSVCVHASVTVCVFSCVMGVVSHIVAHNVGLVSAAHSTLPHCALSCVTRALGVGEV